jgi:hypothetical protein
MLFSSNLEREVPPKILLPGLIVSDVASRPQLGDEPTRDVIPKTARVDEVFPFDSGIERITLED